MTTAYPPTTALGRFCVADLVESPDPYVSSMPLAGLCNPVTGAPSIGPLAVLVDRAGGLVNHCRRASDEWTVSAELSLEVSADALSAVERAPQAAVVATARPIGTKGSSALGHCELTVGETTIGVATVRSAYIAHPGDLPQPWPQTGDGSRPSDLAEIMALHVEPTDGVPIIRQRDDPALNNSLGIMHGGVAAAGVELAASAVLNSGGAGEPFVTASLRVNFLRRFVSGGESRYTARALRVGRRTAVADAQAVGADGEIALVARVTAYR